MLRRQYSRPSNAGRQRFNWPLIFLATAFILLTLSWFHYLITGAARGGTVQQTQETIRGPRAIPGLDPDIQLPVKKPEVDDKPPNDHNHPLKIPGRDQPPKLNHTDNVDGVVPKVANDIKLTGVKDPSLPKISALCLVFGEFSSLLYTFETYEKEGFFDYVDEFILLVNGEKRTIDKVTELGPWKHRITRVMHSHENLLIGEALTRLIEAASHELVIFLEKDFQLIEHQTIMVQRMDEAKRLVISGEADLVRGRHRHHPGFPMYAQIMGENRESRMFGGQSNLYCFVYHWMDDPVSRYPEYFRWCKPKFPTEKPYLCSPSKYCLWTNNPQVFYKSWYVQNFEKRFRGETRGNPWNDFEFFMNWNFDVWNDRNFTIAFGEGLFRHGEREDHVTGEMKYYAAVRRESDLADMRLTLLSKESELRQCKSADCTKRVLNDYKSFVERYPKMVVGFTDHGLNATVEQQFRLIKEQEDAKQGGFEEYETKHGWSAWSWFLHLQAQRAKDTRPEAAPVSPLDAKYSLVTSIYSSDEEERLVGFLKNQDYDKIVFGTDEIKERVYAAIGDQEKKRLHWISSELKDIENDLPKDSAKLINDLRKSDKWLNQPGVKDLPFAGNDWYLIIQHAKMFQLRRAVHLNPWKSSHMLWIDLKYGCFNEQRFLSTNDWIIKVHTLDGFLFGYQYKPLGDNWNGFNAKDFKEIFLGTTSGSVKAVSGSIFGGSLVTIDAIVAMYKIVFRAALRGGYLGTDENTMTILTYRVPELFSLFSNSNACKENTDGAHECGGFNNPHGDCAIFSWVQDGPTSK